jgi:hypothetical protein
MYRLLLGRYPFNFRSGLLPVIADTVLNDDPVPPLSLLSASHGGDLVSSGASLESEASIATKRSVSAAKLRTIFGSDLSLVMLRSIQKDRAKRYQSALDLSHDLKAWMSNRSTTAAALPSGASQNRNRTV